jgi:capsular polysaccharide transport system ATP-binding protein
MIHAVNISSKEYQTEGRIHWVSNGITCTVASVRSSLCSAEWCRKSTFNSRRCGVELPASGTIERNMTVSWPIGLAGGVHPFLTGNDNMRFIARIYNKAIR